MGGEAAAKTKTPEEIAAEEQAAREAAEAEAAGDKPDGEADGAAGSAGEDGGEEDKGFDVVEGDGTSAGAGRVVPLAAHKKLREKLKGKVKLAQEDAAAKAQETELLKLQLAQRDEEIARLRSKPLPKLEDFGGDTAKYEEAVRKHVEEATKARAEPAKKPDQPAPAAADDDADDAVLQGYQERAAKLKAPDFEEAEDAVIEAIGPKATRHIIGLYDNSEAVVYALGKNPKRLGELVSEFKTDPVRAIKNLTVYASKLQLKPRGKAPEPDSGDELKPSGGGGSDAQKQLERIRNEVHEGKRPFQDILKFKQECKAKGVKVE